MNNTKTTKRALLSSVMAMLICITMLIGTTFAWFTDSASTAVNKIQAGNLNVKLEYLNDNEWTEVSNTTKLFKENALWEPGYTEIAYLRVSNAGSLALKYKFAVNKYAETIGVNVVDGSPIKLSEILKFGIIGSETQQSYTRDTARADVAANPLTLNTYTNDIRLGVGETKYYTVVVYMPEEIGNEANHATGTTPPSIDLGINLVATQDTVEYDSFGYTYDQNAGEAEGYTVTAVIPVETVAKALNTNIVTKNESGIFTAHEEVNREQTVEAGGIAVTYPNGTVLDTNPAAGTSEGTVASTQDAKQGFTYSGTTSAHSITVGEGENASVYELTLPVSQNNTTLVKVVEKIASDLTMTAVYHNGVAMAQAASADATPTGESYYYNSATGELVLWVYHASEIATVTENKAPVESMFPDVNVTILSSIVAKEDTVMTDAASGTSAKIPAAAVGKGIVNEGQKVYLVIETTVSEENSKTYDISIRDANGNPFNWTIDCMPEVKFCLGKAVDLFPEWVLNITDNPVRDGWVHIYDRRGAERYPEAEYGNQYYDGTGNEYGAFKYGDQYTPGMTYDPATGFVTLRSLTFE